MSGHVGQNTQWQNPLARWSACIQGYGGHVAVLSDGTSEQISAEFHKDPEHLPGRCGMCNSFWDFYCIAIQSLQRSKPNSFTASHIIIIHHPTVFRAGQRGASFCNQRFMFLLPYFILRFILSAIKKISQVLHLISKYTHVNQVKYFSYFDIDQKNNSLILN